MGYKIITPPGAEPLLLADVKTRLSIDDTHSDTALTSHIKSARLKAEEYTGKKLITQTIEFALDYFPDEIEVPVGPLQSITSIKYLDTDGAEQTLGSGNYTYDDYSPRTWIVPTAGNTWPSTYDAMNAVKVRVVVGYGDAGSDVPEDILLAMHLAVGHWINHMPTVEAGRETIPIRMPREFHDLLTGYRTFKF